MHVCVAETTIKLLAIDRAKHVSMFVLLNIYIYIKLCIITPPLTMDTWIIKWVARSETRELHRYAPAPNFGVKTRQDCCRNHRTHAGTSLYVGLKDARTVETWTGSYLLKIRASCLFGHICTQSQKCVCSLKRDVIEHSLFTRPPREGGGSTPKVKPFNPDMLAAV